MSTFVDSGEKASSGAFASRYCNLTVMTGKGILYRQLYYFLF